MLDDILVELRAIRAAVERLTPTEPHVVDRGWVDMPSSGPVYTCGHRHRSRADAVRCLAEQQAQREDAARYGVASADGA